MQKNTSVTLGKHFDTFVVQQIENGRFSSASKAIKAGLRLLEEKELKLNALKQALEEGENSGYGEYSLKGIIQELDNEKENGPC